MSEKGGFFGRLKERLTKTRSQLVDGVRRVLTGRSPSEDAFFDDLEQTLIEADLGVETATGVLADLREQARAQRLRETADVLHLLRNHLVDTLRPGDHSLRFDTESGPHVTLIAGVNGSGKTTTIGKLAQRLKASGKTVILGAADTFRAAAADQLTIWSERVGVPIVRHQEGSDPAAVAFDTVQAAAARNIDCVIIDTAGRLHTKVNLMEELKKVQRVIAKRLPGAPHETLLILDATTGQNGLQQARIFTEALRVTGIVITKLDGTAKGGIAVAIQKQLGVPIKLIGVGEAVEDLQDFDPEAFVDALLGL